MSNSNKNNLTEILINTTSGDSEKIRAAEKLLENGAKSNLAMFLGALMNELSDESKPQVSRQAAGLYLKNIFWTNDVNRKTFVNEQWSKQDEKLKGSIQKKLLETLFSKNRSARRTTSQVLAVLTEIELNQQKWGNVVQFLIQSSKNSKNLGGVEACLTSLGYICEKCNSPILSKNSSAILTGVIFRMNQNQPNEIRLAATNALYNLIEFINSNFQIPEERNLVMKTLCQTTQSNDEEVRTKALECIVKISSIYYQFIPNYIQAFLQISKKATQTDEEPVALQAIEIWATIAEHEIDIHKNNDLLIELGIDDEQPKHCHEIIKNNIKPIIQILIGSLCKEDEDSTDEELNKSNSSGTCLDIVTKICGNEAVQETLPFIIKNLQNPDWKFREAATFAFGAILDNDIDEKKMSTLLNKALPSLLNQVKDKVVVVKDTTTFTIGRICQFHPQILDNENHFQNIIKALLYLLNDQARVASRACWAISKIAEYYEDDTLQETYPLSQYFHTITGMLMKTSDKISGYSDQYNMKTTVYETLASLFNSAAKDTFPFLNSIIPGMIKKLEIYMNTGSVSVQERENYLIVLGSLCSILSSISRKLGPKMKAHSVQMMKLYLTILSKTQMDIIHEEAILSIAALAESIGSQFNKFMNHFLPFFLKALGDKKNYDLCSTSINIIGNLCTALGKGFANYSDKIMALLLKNLQDKTFDKKLKPKIIQSFADIAIAIRGNFDKYLKYVEKVLKEASDLKPNPNDDQMVNYCNELREAVFDAYTGILQGLKKENARAFHPYVDNLLNFIKIVSEEQTVDEYVFRGAVNCVGDLANVYGPKIKAFLNKDFIMKMIQAAKHSKDKDTRDTARWTDRELRKWILN